MAMSMIDFNRMTADNITRMHKTMRSKGFEKRSYRQSAMEAHSYTKGSHRVEYNGHHGTGTGNRFYGHGKKPLSLYDSGVEGYKPVLDIDHDKWDYNWRVVPDWYVDIVKKFWSDLHSYIEAL